MHSCIHPNLDWLVALVFLVFEVVK
uniref:Uncharacterized protein n=1 Tax=Arundo donax TaxID=35708 RepID=A0A0A9FK87_ARUDO